MVFFLHFLAFSLLLTGFCVCYNFLIEICDVYRINLFMELVKEKKLSWSRRVQQRAHYHFIHRFSVALLRFDTFKCNPFESD